MAYRSSASATGNSGGTLAATPAGVAVNDYLLGFWTADAGNVATTPTGWTQRGNADTAGSDQQTTRGYDKVAAGSDSFSWAFGSANQNTLHTFAFSGRDTTAPRTFFTTTTQATGQVPDGSGNVSCNLTSGTAAAGDDLCYFVGGDQTVGAAQFSFTAPSGFTERQDTRATSWTCGGSGSQDNHAGGAVGTLAVIAHRDSGTGNLAYGGFAVAIKAAAGGGPVIPVFMNQYRQRVA